MESINKHNKILIIFSLYSLIILIGSIPNNVELNQTLSKTTENLSPKICYVIEIGHSPLYFKNNSEMDAYFASNETDGSDWNSAYILDSFHFNQSGTGSGIILENCSRYLIIRNCIFENSGNSIPNFDSGIKINQTHNIRIENCHFSNNQLLALCLINATNIEIENVDFEYNYHNIYAYSFNSSFITDCQIHNGLGGISGSYYYDISLTNFEIYDVDNQGLSITQANNLNLTNISVISSGSTSIRLETIKNTIIQNCFLYNGSNMGINNSDIFARM